MLMVRYRTFVLRVVFRHPMIAASPKPASIKNRIRQRLVFISIYLSTIGRQNQKSTGIPWWNGCNFQECYHIFARHQGSRRSRQAPLGHDRIRNRHANFRIWKKQTIWIPHWFLLSGPQILARSTLHCLLGTPGIFVILRVTPCRCILAGLRPWRHKQSHHAATPHSLISGSGSIRFLLPKTKPP